MPSTKAMYTTSAEHVQPAALVQPTTHHPQHLFRQRRRSALMPDAVNQGNVHNASRTCTASCPSVANNPQPSTSLSPTTSVRTHGPDAVTHPCCTQRHARFKHVAYSRTSPTGPKHVAHTNTRAPSTSPTPGPHPPGLSTSPTPCSQQPTTPTSFSLTTSVRNHARCRQPRQCTQRQPNVYSQLP